MTHILHNRKFGVLETAGTPSVVSGGKSTTICRKCRELGGFLWRFLKNKVEKMRDFQLT